MKQKKIHRRSHRRKRPAQLSTPAVTQLAQLAVVELPRTGQFQVNLVRFGARPNDPEMLDLRRYSTKRGQSSDTAKSPAEPTRTRTGVLLPINSLGQLITALTTAQTKLARRESKPKTSFDGQAEEHQRAE